MQLLKPEILFDLWFIVPSWKVRYNGPAGKFLFTNQFSWKKCCGLANPTFSHLSKMWSLCWRTSDLAKLLDTAFKKKRQSFFHSNNHVLAAVRTLLSTSCSPPHQSSGTPALLAHVHQLQALTHLSASLMSLIRLRPSHPRGIYRDGLSQQSLCASEITKNTNKFCSCSVAIQ